MEVSAHLHQHADLSVPRKQQAIIKSFAKALEIIPRQLCDNAGFDATNILTQLRVEHRKGNVWAGVDFDNEGVRDNMAAFVWEPSLVKVNAVMAAVEASCLILSVDETISMLFFLVLGDELGRRMIANESCRKRAIRATASTSAWPTSWRGTTSATWERERHAEKMRSARLLVAYCRLHSEIDTIMIKRNSISVKESCECVAIHTPTECFSSRHGISCKTTIRPPSPSIDVCNRSANQSFPHSKRDTKAPRNANPAV